MVYKKNKRLVVVHRATSNSEPILSVRFYANGPGLLSSHTAITYCFQAMINNTIFFHLHGFLMIRLKTITPASKSTLSSVPHNFKHFEI